MEKTFSKREALKQTYATARMLALPILPYFLVAASVVIALYTVSAVMSGGSTPDFLIGLVELILISSVAVLFYLKALKRSDPAEHLLRDTRNVFFATLLMGLLFGIIGFLLALFFSVFAGILLANDGFDPETFNDDPALIAQQIGAFLQEPAGMIIGALLLVACLALAWLAARLVLYGIATAASGRIRVFETWGWSKQNGFSILLVGLVVSFLPSAIMLAGILGITHQLETATTSLWQATLINETSRFGLLYPVFLLGHGFAVAVYRQLSPELVDVEDAFG